MKIEAVSISLPSWKVSNEEVIDLIRFNSKSTFYGDLEKTLRKISVVLRKTGANTRYWLNKQINEKPIDHVIKAAEGALKKANMSKDDIDVLIYVGIGKGFLEPAQSYFVAKALGMNKVKCYDVTDACMSWMTSLQIVDSYFKAGVYKTAMIVNAEFTVQGGVLFKNFSLKNDNQLDYSFPSYTVGEASTCTILSDKKHSEFDFNFLSVNQSCDLCVIPLENYKLFNDFDDVAKMGSLHFTSFGVDLHKIAENRAQEVIDKKRVVDIVFTHASSKNEWQKYANNVGLGDKVFHIYQDSGNLVSASIPAAMAIAEEKNLVGGKKILAWVGSAGMSFGSCYFNF